MNPKKQQVANETLEVEIERILPGGVGLAHAEGLTLFVSLAAPGDRVRVKVDRVQGKVAFASIVEILTPSPVRVEPPCPYFGLCGGCDFQQLSYDVQLATKVEIIKDCLHRIGKIDGPIDVPILASPREWQYRTRAMWQVDADKRKVGYFVRGSREVCDVEYCAVLVSPLQNTLEKVRTEILSENGTTPTPRDIAVVLGDDGISIYPPIAGFETREVHRVVEDEIYEYSAEAFFQVNHGMLEALIAEAIGDISGKIAIDLYSGVGLFTLPLTRRFEEVVAVEANPEAMRFARRSLESANLDRIELANLDVGEWLQHYRSFEPIDILLLDPPRTGVENKVIAGIVGLRPQRIVYVSCDPATLARDLKKLIAEGYSFDKIAAFDMFPQTHHVEMVVHLSDTIALIDDSDLADISDFNVD
ncbi:MAG TPA: class I SAM-dependent RNA methyltransferase [Pyrinomonadaceae bacterium]|nr:class I SAM-dependent RNA methyltransferase [Pyrinomonadaceae bacterium]